MRKTRVRMGGLFTVIAGATLLASLSGCGGTYEAPPLDVGGLIQQGNVKGAYVFADLNGDREWQKGEEPCTLDNQNVADQLTDAAGHFKLKISALMVAKLKANPGYKLVSVGGTDQTTGNSPGFLMADPPANVGDLENKSMNITPLTTLVAALPSAAAKEALVAKLGELGLPKDAKGNVIVDTPIASTNVTPAIIALVKSVETVLTVTQNATASTGNVAVSVDVAEAVASKMAEAISTKTSAQLTDTATLATTLAVAAGEGIKQVDQGTTQMTVTVAQVTAIVNAIDTGCKQVADAVKSQTGGTLSTSGTVSETTVVTAVATQITTAVNTATETTESNVTVAPPPPPAVASDTTPPAVVLTSVGTFSDVVLKPAVNIQFSEDVNGVSTSTIILTTKGTAVAGTVSYDATTHKATFTPTNNLTANTTYTVTVLKTITDKAGNAMNGDVTLTFTTTKATGAAGGTSGGTGLNF
jgi:Bacterial Ig-like domain